MANFITRIRDKLLDAALSHLAVLLVGAAVSGIAVAAGYLIGVDPFWLILAAGAFLGISLVLVLAVATNSLRKAWTNLSRPLFWSLISVASVTLISLIVIGYQVYTLRRDIDWYVMPRELTAKQISHIEDVLRSYHESHEVTVEVADNDQEAANYMSQIISAINGSGWLVTGTTTVKTSNEGVCIEVAEVGQPKNPDPRHPTPDQQLTTALQGLTNCGGSSFNQSLYSVSVIVGHRPFSVEPPSWWQSWYQPRPY